jgi:hypothetical protein
LTRLVEQGSKSQLSFFFIFIGDYRECYC